MSRWFVSRRGDQWSGLGRKANASWTGHVTHPKLLNSHTTTKLRLCANAAWSLIVTITSPDGPHARRLARTAGASPPTAAPPPGAVPSTPSVPFAAPTSSFVVIIAPETRDETTNRERKSAPSDSCPSLTVLAAHRSALPGHVRRSVRTTSIAVHPSPNLPHSSSHAD